MSAQSEPESVVTLTDREGAVIRCAIEYFLDEGKEYADVPGADIESTLETHYETATARGEIPVQPGMSEFYQTVFREYARAIQRTVEPEDFSEANGQFFEESFKSIVDKIRDAGTGSEFQTA